MTHTPSPRRPGVPWADTTWPDQALGQLAEMYGFTFTADQMRLLTADREALDVPGRQHRYILGLALEPVPCPHCHTLTCRLAAYTGEFSFTEDNPDDAYTCPSCGTKLTWHVALIAGGQWFTSRAPLAAAPLAVPAYPMGRRIGQPGDPIRVAVGPPKFTAGEPVEFRDRSRRAEWEPGTFVRYDAPGNEHPAGPQAVVAYADVRKGSCRTEVTRIRPAGTDQDGGA